MSDIKVGILMGSDSDFDVMEQTVKVLKGFGIGFEVTVSSAHRTPDKTLAYAKTARERGLKVLIAGAGHAAHLGGFLAAKTPLPIIAVPIDSSALKGMDALLATVMMPGGVPVASMAIGKAGAKNAGIFAAQILAASDSALMDKVIAFREKQAEGVEEKDKKLQEKLS